jgi:hypothetical protein
MYEMVYSNPGPRMPSKVQILAQYKREVAAALVSGSGGRMSKGSAQRLTSKHLRVVRAHVKAQRDPSEAARAIASRAKICTVGQSGKYSFSEGLNPLSDQMGWLLGLAAVGGIGAAIYFANRKTA